MRARKNAGFTLVEVLVSLLIFSTAILGLMSAGHQNIRIVQTIEKKQIAGVIADNQLLLIIHGPAPLKRSTQQNRAEMAGQYWHWRVITSETSQPGFYKLTAEVTEENSERVLVRRTAFSRNKQKSAQ